jgi:hypothetical protein
MKGFNQRLLNQKAIALEWRFSINRKNFNIYKNIAAKH